MSLSPDNVFVQLAALAMTPDDEKPAFLQSHPQLCTVTAGEAAIQVARLRGMMQDLDGQLNYTGAAVYIAGWLQDVQLAIRACRTCAEVAESIGHKEIAEQYNAMAVSLASKG